MKDAKDDGYFLKLYSEFNTAFHIQFPDSYDVEKQTERLKSVERFVGARR